MSDPTDPTEAQRTDNDQLHALLTDWGEGQLTPGHADVLVAQIVANGWVGPRRMRTIEHMQALVVDDWQKAHGELRDQLTNIRHVWANCKRGWMTPKDVAEAMRKALAPR